MQAGFGNGEMDECIQLYAGIGARLPDLTWSLVFPAIACCFCTVWTYCCTFLLLFLFFIPNV